MMMQSARKLREFLNNFWRYEVKHDVTMVLTIWTKPQGVADDVADGRAEMYL